MFDTFCYWFYLIHIPVTVLIDSSVVIPPVFQFQKCIVDFHINSNKDILLTSKPLWFKGFVWIELLFQLPWFLYATTQYDAQSVTIQLWNVVYGVNAAITTIGSILYVLEQGEGYGLTQMESYKLAAIYFPYVIIPAVIAIGGFAKVKTLTQLKK